jgi:hypothetical protein
MKCYLFILFLFFCSGVSSQTNGLGKEPKPKEGLKLESFGYPVFLGGEEHGSFHLTYPITSTLTTELNAFYDTYILSNQFRSNILLKNYLDENWYLFSGVEAEYSIKKYPSLESQKEVPPRIGVVSGIGYEVNKNFQVEARSNFQINNSSVGAFGEPLIPMPQVYTLKGKFKF